MKMTSSPFVLKQNRIIAEVKQQGKRLTPFQQRQQDFNQIYKPVIDKHVLSMRKRLHREFMPSPEPPEHRKEPHSLIQPEKSARQVEAEEKMVKLKNFGSMIAPLQKRKKNQSISNYHRGAIGDAIDQHALENDIVCLHCEQPQAFDTKFETKTQLFKHIETTHKGFVCKHCETVYWIRAQQRQCCQDKKHYAKGYTCGFCKRHFTTRPELRKHTMGNSEKKCGLYCGIDKCKKYFYSEQEMVAHQASYHQTMNQEEIDYIHVCKGQTLQTLSESQRIGLHRLQKKEDISKKGEFLEPDYYPSKLDCFVLTYETEVRACLEYKIQVDPKNQKAFVYCVKTLNATAEEMQYLMKLFFEQLQRRRVTRVFIEYSVRLRDYFRLLGFYKPHVDIKHSMTTKSKSSNRSLELGYRILDNFECDATPYMMFDESLPHTEEGLAKQVLIDDLKATGFLQSIKDRLNNKLIKYDCECVKAKPSDQWISSPKIWDKISSILKVHRSWFKDLTPLKRDFDKNIDWDFLANPWFDCINITNPPYTLSHECCLKAMIEWIENERSVIIFQPAAKTNCKLFQETLLKFGQKLTIPAQAMKGAYREFQANLSFVLLESPRLIDYKQWMDNKYKQTDERQNAVNQQSFRQGYKDHQGLREKVCQMTYEKMTQQHIQAATSLTFNDIKLIREELYNTWLSQQSNDE